MVNRSSCRTIPIKNMRLVTGSFKHYLKIIRWRIRRIRVRRHYGLSARYSVPIVFGNAMPKSGSHLLTQILKGLTGLGPFIDPGFPPVNRSEGNQPLPQSAVIKNLRDMRPGDIRYGYIHAEEPFLSILTNPDWATIFLYRDPRDMILSHVFYATDMNPRHGMHSYYTETLNNMEERINAAIIGVTKPGFELSSVKQRYDSYMGWLDQSDVLCLKFEDLILDREPALASLLDFLAARDFSPPLPRQEAIDYLSQSIEPRKSGTFRKGIPGNWKEHFSETNKATFKQVAGDLLLELGYEQDDSW